LIEIKASSLRGDQMPGAAATLESRPLSRTAIPPALSPELIRTVHDGHLELAAAGSWTAAHVKRLEALVDEIAHEDASAASAALNMSRVDEFDTYGAWLLERLTRVWQSRGSEMRIVDLPAH
jgi:phospholipid/cholesterol/gamma-HCH transport system permease protein